MLLLFCKYNTISDFPVLRHNPHETYLRSDLANDSDESTSVNSGGNLGDVRMRRYCECFVSYCVSKCCYVEALPDSIQFKIKLIICGIFSQRFWEFSTTLSKLGPPRPFSPWKAHQAHRPRLGRAVGGRAVPNNRYYPCDIWRINFRASRNNRAQWWSCVCVSINICAMSTVVEWRNTNSMIDWLNVAANQVSIRFCCGRTLPPWIQIWILVINVTNSKLQEIFIALIL